MGELWASKRQAAGLSGCSTRSQELCLTAYLDACTAGQAAYLLAALSRACHYHSYELTPTAAELTGWLDQAAQIVIQIQAASAT
jgi:hypothetical protein